MVAGLRPDPLGAYIDYEDGRKGKERRVGREGRRDGG